jgi:hypothetical protein
MKEAHRACVRRIEERINSRIHTEGLYSPFGRTKPEAVKAMAEAIAAANPNRTLDEDDLRRSVLLFLGRHPAAGRTHQETTALVNKRYLNEQAKVVVRGVTKEFLNKLTPAARLHFANTGELPDKYIRKDLLDE